MGNLSASSLLDVFEEVFFVFDETGRLVEWNARTAAYVEADEGTLGTATVPELFAGADAERVSRALSEVFDAGSATVEVRSDTDDIGTAPYEIELRQLDDGADGKPRYAGVGHDISAREYYRGRATHRQQVLQRIYEIISDTGQEFEAQVTALLELGRAELDVKYGTLSEIHGEDYHFQVVSADDDSIQSGDVVPVGATNCEIVAADEQTLVLDDVARDAPEETDRAGYVEWGISCYIGAPVVLDDGVYGTFCFYDTNPRTENFTEWDATLVDILSRWVSYELQNQRDKTRLQRQNDKLERFASIVSHDLRNPLNVLSGSLELVVETGDAEHVDRAHNAVDRMETLIEDLLTLSRAGESIDQLEPVDLAAVVERCWNTTSVSAGTLTVGVDRTIRADPTRLQQLFENLFRNAIEHADDGVRVTVGDVSDGFYVEDDGPGVPADERERIFESGYTTNAEGTGFGLAIVEEIAVAHGWDVVAVEGTAGGARFEFTGISDVDESEEKPES